MLELSHLGAKSLDLYQVEPEGQLGYVLKVTNEQRDFVYSTVLTPHELRHLHTQLSVALDRLEARDYLTQEEPDGALT